MLNLYDQYGVLKATFEPDDSSEQNAELQSDNELSLSFTMYECVVFEVNDYIDFEGTRFWAIEQYTPDQTSTVEWEYSVSLYGVESLVQRYLVLKLSNGEYEPIFSYTATAQGHMELIVAALNDGMGTTDWKVGEVVSTDYIIIDYNCTYGNTALSNLASEAGTEYWFDNGMTINLTQAEHGDEITLAYGNGLLNLYRENADNVAFFTRFIPIGSSRNIVYDDYGYTRLQLPDKAKYVDIDVDKYGVIHYAETDAFSDIYPRRIGTISSVRAEECVNDDGDTFYVYYVQDDTLTFDPNDYIMDGLVINITFQSGDLNGRDFEVNYNSTTKEFEIINQYPYDDSTIQLPGSLLMEVGDTYVLWNLEMPSEYRTLAEIEYEEAVYAFIEENLKDIGIYKGTTDYVELEKRGTILTLGQRIRLESDKYFPSTGYRSSRLTKLTRNVNHPKTIDIEVSDVLSTGTIDKINDDLTTVKNYTEQSLSGLPDVIKSWESTPAADTNLYSSKKSVKEFLSKTSEDTAQKLIKFKEGAQSKLFKTPSWSGGTLGNGGALIEDDTTGESTLVVHNVVAKNGITAPTFTVRTMTATGGIDVTSAAYAVLTKVEDGEGSWECYYNSSGQMWKALDQAKLYNGSGGYLWALVTAVSDQPNEDGEYSFTLSKTITAAGSNVSPAIDDTLVLQGNRSTDSADNYRQTFLVRSCGVDNEAEGYYPYEAKYIEIDDFSLTEDKRVYWNGKEYELKVNKFSITSPDGTVYRQPVDRGSWSTEDTPYYEYERVSHQEALWQCVAESSNVEPSITASDWVRVAYQGADGIDGADGADGVDGVDGDSVESIVNQYYLHTSKDEIPEIDDSDWSDTPIESESGKYLWRREKITYTSGKVEYTDPRWDYAEQSAELASLEQIKNFFDLSDTQSVEDALDALEQGAPFTIVDSVVAISNAIIANLVVKQLMTEGGKIALNNDGSGQLANGRISWDADGNITGDFDAIYTGNKEVYHEGNCNNTTVDWSAKNLALAGAITGATSITASGDITTTADVYAMGVASWEASGSSSGDGLDSAALYTYLTSNKSVNSWGDTDYISDTFGSVI